MKIGVLFKSEVGKIDYEYTAGAERVFLQDLELFQKQKIPYQAYCAGKALDIPSGINLKPIHYPRFLYKFKNRFINNYRIFKLFSSLIFIADIFYAIYFVIKAWNDDVWYTYQVFTLAIINPKKTIIACHNFVEIPFNRLFRWRLTKAKYCFCSEFLKQQYKNAYPWLNKANLKVIYNGIKICHSTKQTTKKTLQMTFVYLSTWTQEKGIYLLMDAIRIIEKKYPNKIHFLIAGSADLWYNDDKSYINRLQNDCLNQLSKLQSVTILGRINHNQISKMISKSNYLLLPSTWGEAFALVILESMESGVPVVSFKVGGVPEIIRNNYNGFLIENINRQGLTNLISNLIKKNNFGTNLRNNCLKTATEFSDIKRKKILINYLTNQI